MYIPQPVITMYFTISAQTIKLNIQSVSFYEWVFMYMYLRINSVAYWLLLITQYVCRAVELRFDTDLSQTPIQGLMT